MLMVKEICSVYNGNIFFRIGGKFLMFELSQIELQELRNLILTQITEEQKLINYAEYAVDPQIKQIFNKAAEDCANNKEKLMKFFEGGIK